MPNKVPWGPRSTSMRSISSTSNVACPGLARTTPSMMVDTVGSTPGDVEMVPIPRIKILVSLFPPCCLKSTLGNSAAIVSMLLRLDCNSSSPLNTETAMGTERTDASRRVAVTVTDGRPPSSGGLLSSAAALSDRLAPARRANRC